MHPVGQVVNQVLHHEHVAVTALDLKDALHHITPAQQHVAFGVGQIRTGRHELLDDRLAVAQPVLQHEVIEDHGQLLLIDNDRRHVLVAEQHLAERPVVLITSRRRIAALDAVAQHQLDLLPPVEAMALFLAVAGPRATAEPDEAASVVQLCGRCR